MEYVVAATFYPTVYVCSYFILTDKKGSLPSLYYASFV